MFDLALPGGWAGAPPAPALPASSAPAAASADAQVAGEVLALFDELMDELASDAPVEGAVETPGRTPATPIPAPHGKTAAIVGKHAAVPHEVNAFVPAKSPAHEKAAEIDATPEDQAEPSDETEAAKRFPESFFIAPVAVESPELNELERGLGSDPTPSKTTQKADKADTTDKGDDGQSLVAASAHDAAPADLTPRPAALPTPRASHEDSMRPAARTPVRPAPVREEPRATTDAPRREMPAPAASAQTAPELPDLPALPEPAAHAEPMAAQVSHVFNQALTRPFVADESADDAVEPAAAPSAREARPIPAASRPPAATHVTSAKPAEVTQMQPPVLPRPVVPVNEVHRDRPDFDRPRPVAPAVAGAIYAATTSHTKHFTFDAAPAANASVAEQPSLPASTGDQIVQSLRMALMRDGGEARITLNPREFGDLTVTVKVEQGAVVARMQADTPAVREWLHANQDTLRARLADQELRLDRLDIASPEETGESRHDAEGRRRDEHARERPRPRRPHHSATFEVVA